MLLSSKIKIGLGAHKVARMLPNQYKLVVETALRNGVDTLECPAATDNQKDNHNALHLLAEMIHQPTTILQRVGYRTIKKEQQMAGDLLLEEKQKGVDEEHLQVVHNLSVSYMHHVMKNESSLPTNNNNVSIVPMIQNPEVHQHDTADRLTEAFCGLEEIIRQQQQHQHQRIKSFGVVSNGLSLPTDHPLHLDYRIVLNAADRAAKELGLSQSSLSILQLPINLGELENGMQVATKVKSLQPQLQIYAMRPLAFYPDFGTGTGQAISLVDYLLPQGPEEQEWTHLMPGPPPFYHQMLNTAMSHFDGEALLEAKQTRDLTEEETETLRGANYLQSLLQELDAGISSVSSMSAHEEHIMNVVIPTLFGTFEALDEPSAQILSNFFASHGWTVRHALATKTRKMLLDKKFDISPQVKLQEYALQYLLKEHVIDKVIVGATQPEHIVDAVGVWNKMSH